MGEILLQSTYEVILKTYFFDSWIVQGMSL
jgi:hypothetical protein